MNPYDLVRMQLSDEADMLLEVIGNLDHDDVTQVYDAITLSSFTWFTGVGKTGQLAQRAAGSFASLGLVCAYVDATQLLHGDLGAVKKNHSLITVSLSGQSSETITAFEKTQATTRALIGPRLSELGSHATAVLDPRMPEVDTLIPLESLTIQGSILNGLVAQYRQSIGPLRMKLNHPGGTLGDRQT